MEKVKLAYRKTNYFSKLICDYIDEESKLQPFYNRFPTLKNFQNQIYEKQKAYSTQHRVVLTATLQKQYKTVKASTQTHQNIERLQNENTFTITTGHQLNLFTGPLYVIYKICSVIALTQQLQKVYSNYNFVPVFWMASEDHDFKEINHFNTENQTITWHKNAKGAVGRLSTEGLDEVYKSFSETLDASQYSEELKQLFNAAYLKHNTLAEATRFLINELFGTYGLVIINADDALLKAAFRPYIKRELCDKTAKTHIEETTLKLVNLDQGYKQQVTPRDINLFYIKDNLRERIVYEAKVYKILNTNISFSEAEILKELDQFPERFSPNVVMRPLYQEVILPNLGYVGGAGELAYWLQLKAYFTAEKVPFPMLLLRNSVLYVSKQQQHKLEKLGFTIAALFLNQTDLLTKFTEENTAISIDFSKQKQTLKQQFKALYKIAKQTDKSFIGAVAAQERKQIKGLEHLEKRLLKAEKRQLSDKLQRVKTIQNQLFPNQSLQERYYNFSTIYKDLGSQFIPMLIKQLQPLEFEFTIFK